MQWASDGMCVILGHKDFTSTVTAPYYPRDAMLARVFATATCLSVRLSVCHEPVLYQNEES